MHIRFLTVILTLLAAGTLTAQEPLDHPHQMYQSPEGKIYVNRNDPIYLRIATSPKADTTSHLLQSEATEAYANPMYFDTEGYNTIRSPWRINPETKEYERPKHDVVFGVYADSKPPKTQVKFGTDELLWRQGRVIAGEPVQISFNKQDALSGVAGVYYSIDQEKYQRFLKPVTIDRERSFTLAYYGVDHVGNAEKPQKIRVKLDLTSPRTRLQVEGDRHENIISGRSIIRLKTKDSISGVAQTRYILDSGSVKTYRSPIQASKLKEGEHTLSYYSLDQVSNREDKELFTFYVDKTPPRVVEEFIGNTFTASGREYFSGRTRIKFISMDNQAGVKEIRYSINGGDYQVYQRPFSVSQGGNLTLETIAVDRVNNKRQSQRLNDRSGISYGDLTGPKISHHYEGPVFSTTRHTFITSSTQIRLKGTDNESGLKRIEYRHKKHQQTKTYKAPFSLDEEGEHTINYTGYDNLKNASSKTLRCIVDQQGPAIHHRFSVAANQNEKINGEAYPVYPPHTILYLSATDSLSGCNKINYSINGQPQRPYQQPIKGFQINTLYRIKLTAFDKLGNKRNATIRFYIGE